MSDDTREAQPSPIVEGKWPEGGPQRNTVIYLDAPPINVVVGMLCVLCEHARPGSLDTVPGLMAMVRETAQKLAAQPSAQGEDECERSRQINTDRDRLWEENGIPAAQPEPSAQGEAVACVTEEMVTAYLTANDAYWKRIDGEPTKLGKWRNGTPSEATRVSLMAALAAAPAAPARPVPLTEAQVIALWHQDHEAHQRLSAFEWFAAGVIAAERAHKISTGEVG